jgi:integrase/recombinase XerC
VARERKVPSDWNCPDIITTYQTWLRQRGRSNRTQALYGEILIWLAYWLHTTHGTDLLAATADQLTAWRTGLQVEPDTITQYVGAIAGFYKWAARGGRIDADPAWDIPIPRRTRGGPRPIGAETLRAAIEEAPPRIRPLLILAAYCGLRACEIAVLRREDIHDTAARPYLRIHGKGDKWRMVPLTPYVWGELLAAGLPRRGPVFRRADGGRGGNTAQRISALCNEYLHDHDIEETLHQLRHFFATATYAAVRDLRVVQELMGHSNISTTQGYAAYSDDVAVQAVHAITPTHHRGGTRTLRLVRHPDDPGPMSA